MPAKTTKKRYRGRTAKLIAIFSHKRYIALTAIFAAILYALFYYLITANNKGIFLITIPVYVIYLLVITSGILLSISVFAAAYSIASKKAEAAGGILGILLPSIGGVVATCACDFPILASILTIFGVNTIDAVGIISEIGDYGAWIMGAMIAINLIAIYYYLGKISFPTKR